VVYDEDLLHALEDAPHGPYVGEAFRHMFAGYSPLLANTNGARWNPPDVPAIYASIDRKTALAEAEYRISLEPFRPRAKRTLYQLAVRLENVVDLTDPGLLASVGITDAELTDFTFVACQPVGGAVAWLGHDGMIVPSARNDGQNLVIFPASISASGAIEVMSEEDIPYEGAQGSSD
jgi:RES domain-containing protein